MKYYLGIDIGSTTFKAVVITDKGRVVHTIYQRTKPVDSGQLSCTGRCTSCGRCNMGALKKTLATFFSEAGLNTGNIACETTADAAKSVSDSGITAGDIACTVVTGSQIV